MQKTDAGTGRTPVGSMLHFFRPDGTYYGTEAMDVPWAPWMPQGELVQWLVDHVDVNPGMHLVASIGGLEQGYRMAIITADMRK